MHNQQPKGFQYTFDQIKDFNSEFKIDAFAGCNLNVETVKNAMCFFSGKAIAMAALKLLATHHDINDLDKVKDKFN